MDPVSDTNLVEIGAAGMRVSRNTILTLPELKTRAKSLASDGADVSDEELYFWGATISTNKVDTYYTAMAPSSLRNYAADAEEEDGMAFQNSHRHGELNFGRSLAGKFTGGSGARTDVDFFTIRDFNVNGINTNELIRGMERGILKDVSIGFYGGWYRCSICGEDMFDWSKGWDEMCPHIPGIEYDVKDAKGNVVDRAVAIAFVEDAHASETSIVYDGACPGAAIRKAVMEAEGGRIKPEYANMLQTRYRVNLPGFNQRKYGGVSLPEGKRSMPPEDGLLEPISDEQNQAALDAARAQEEQNPVPQEEEAPAGNTPTEGEAANADPTAQVEVTPAVVETPPAPQNAEPGTIGERTPIVAEIDQPANPADTLRAVMTKVGIQPGQDPEATLRNLAQEVRRNRRFAQDGQTYRRDLIEGTIRAGIKAQGDAFNETSYRTLLENADIETIKGIQSGFQKDASTLIPEGRQTEGGEGDPIIKLEERRPEGRPVSIYKNG